MPLRFLWDEAEGGQWAEMEEKPTINTNEVVGLAVVGGTWPPLPWWRWDRAQHVSGAPIELRVAPLSSRGLSGGSPLPGAGDDPAEPTLAVGVFFWGPGEVLIYSLIVVIPFWGH